MACKAPFHPNRGNYKTDCEHNGNPRKSWFLVLRAGLFTKKTDAQYQADVSGSPILTFRMRAEAEAHWAANCREFHLHEREDKGSEEHPRPSSPLPPSTPARSALRSAPRSAPRSTTRSANAVRASVKRGPLVKDKAGESKTPLFQEDDGASPLSGKVPLFREDDEVSPLSHTRKRPAHSVLPSTPGPGPTSANAVRASDTSANAARGSVKREPPVKGKAGESKMSLFREDDASPLSGKVPLFREDDEVSPLSRTVPLFREDDEVSPLSRTRKRPTHLVLPNTPGPDASPSHATPPSADSAGSISSVSSLSASVSSSASRFAPPLRSLSRCPPSSRPDAPYLHAGSSASTGAGANSSHHPELPVLFNNSTRKLYKDVATAVREMGKKDSIQVLEVEDLEEFLSAPLRAAT
ncbi:hypothetical protein GGX14DRAFT_573991 [Mycena pura]|uniref:Uncharacterized protein n=1 Tax=Mycena pura TaxID=153505 RepID=A0AAD6UYP8_9AGAR|nr:hypothetical protein GGX14DRAFT_573991 [Mycena pura]